MSQKIERPPDNYPVESWWTRPNFAANVAAEQARMRNSRFGTIQSTTFGPTEKRQLVTPALTTVVD